MKPPSDFLNELERERSVLDREFSSGFRYGLCAGVAASGVLLWIVAYLR